MLLFVCGLSLNLNAQTTIASQDFDGLSGNTSCTDMLTSASFLTNTAASNSGGGDLDFSTVWFQTRSNATGPVTPTSDANDFIGVNDFGGSNAPDVGSDGASVSNNKNFQFNDGDGLLSLQFEDIDMSGFTNRTLSFNYWINDTGYESSDAFIVNITDGPNTTQLLGFNDALMESNSSADDGTANWMSFSMNIDADLAGFDDTQIQIQIGVDNNSGTENIFVDNIVVTGDAAPTGGSGCDELFISEYVEGSSFNKYIEVYNPTSSAVDLSNYELRLYSNGASSPSESNTLSGMLPAGDVVVYSNSSATAYTGATTDYTAVNFNGDDAIELYNTATGSSADIFGRIGEDPGSQWNVSGNETKDQTLVRSSSVTAGVMMNPSSGFPTLGTEWTEFGKDDVHDLGQHTADACGTVTPPTCEITNVTITNLACGSAPFEDEAFFDISFDVSGGSGTQYNILNPVNSTAYSVISSGTTDGTVMGPGNASSAAMEGSTAQIVVVDAGNASCMSNPVTINVPVCPDPCPSAGEVFINEFHYDNAGSDVNEFIEVAVSDSYTGALADLSVVLYNGSNGASYDTKTLDQFSPGATAGGVTYYSFTYPTNGIQNGGSDGIALACGSSAFQFLSYEGTLTASNGPAAGMSSTDIGNNEPGSTPVGSSLEFFDGVWLLVCQNTKGSENQGITECCDIEIVSVDATTACPGEGGDITINASCTSCDGIMYSIDGGATFQASNTFTDQPAGNYQIVVQDAADSSCEDMISSMVSGPDGSVPAPWMTTDVGSSGTAGNAYAFDECDDQFTVTGGGNNAFPGTEDAVAFINQTLCGNGAITAKLESVTPNGYGGLMMRETNTASAKQVSIFSNLTNVLRHEARYKTGGNKVTQAHYRPFPFWLRLVRQGNWFFAYYSTTGSNFQYIHAVNVSMNSCVQVGLASFTYLPGQQCEAVFSNVSVSSSATAFQGSADTGTPASTQSAVSPEIQDVQAPGNNTLGQFNVFPNPVSNELNVSFEDAMAEEATIRILSIDGRSLYENVHGIQGATVNIPLSLLNMTEGMYLLQVATGEEVRTERFIKANR